MLFKCKQMMVGTAVGRTLKWMDDARKFVGFAITANPEKAGCASQSRCAQRVLPYLCDPDAVFVDVGAHIGSVSASVVHRQPLIRLIAVEAVPDKAKALARKFPNATVHQCALGESEGEVEFYVDTKRPGFSGLKNNESNRGGIKKILVPMKRLDQLIHVSMNVRVMKIDVEGAELGVLRGASQTVTRCRPIIQFESARETKDSRYTARDLFQWFDERQYEIVVPNRVPHDGPSLNLAGFLEAHYYPFRTLDYFAIPSERREQAKISARRGGRAVH